MKNKSLMGTALPFLTVVASLSFASCQDEDYGFTKQDVRDAVYARNFEKMYGKISEDQIWDFSSYNLKKLGLTGGPSNNVMTRAVPNDQNRATTLNGLVSMTGDFYEVKQTTINWLNEHLTEKVPHNDLVNASFSLSKVAGNDFYIVPIYQGQSGMIWDLELVDDNGRHLLWSKSDNFKYNYDFEHRWEEYFYDTDYYDNKDTYTYNGSNNRGLKFNSIFSLAGKQDLTWARMVFVIPSSLKSVTGRFVNVDTKEIIYDYWFNGTAGSNQSGETTATYNTNDGTFTFTRENNPIIAPDGKSLSKNTNQIDLTRLLTQNTKDNQKFVGSHLEKLGFQITSFEKTDNNSDADASFIYWYDDLSRIKVFVKYDGSKNGVTLSNNSNDAYINGHTINKHDINTKVLTVHSNQIQGDFHFNLHTTSITEGDKGYAAVGDNHESTNGYMYAITHFNGTDAINKKELREALNARGASLNNDDYEYMVLGCEDADNDKGGDKDYNDVVFLVVGGPKLPEISDDPIRKRYMIEDLGSTFDFDFNDIVVDVTEEKVRSLADPSKKKIRQKATISHLSGTIPFKVFIGSKTFGENPMYGHNNNNSVDGYIPADPAYSKTIYESEDWERIPDLTSYRRDHGIWDPDANNIKMYVWPDKTYDEPRVGVYWNGYTGGDVTSDGSANNNNHNDSPNHIYDQTKYQTVDFPHKGRFPYIIATDPSVMWMKELVSIPKSWIQTVPKEYTDYNTNANGGNSGSGNQSNKVFAVNEDFNNNSSSIAGWGGNFNQWYENGCYAVNHNHTENAYDVQLKYSYSFQNGKEYKVEMVVRGSVSGNIQAFLQKSDGYENRSDWKTMNISTNEQTVTCTLICNGDGADGILFNLGHYDGTLYINSIQIYSLN